MFPAMIAMEELCRITIQQSQSLVLIFYRMRMDNIHNHRNIVSVSLVNKLLQLLRGAEA